MDGQGRLPSWPRRIPTCVAGLLLLAVSLAVQPLLAPMVYGVLLYHWPQLWHPAAAAVTAFLGLAVIVAVLLAKWDEEPTPGSWGLHPTIRGDVPKPLRWLQTNDERLPGGLYEETVAKLLERTGRVVCSMYWLGWRNRAHGMRKVFGKYLHGEEGKAALTTLFDEVDGKVKGVRPDGSWFYRKRLFGAFVFVCGHRVYDLHDGRYLVVPTCTAKRA